jgi:hypothetical protein
MRVPVLASPCQKLQALLILSLLDVRTVRSPVLSIPHNSSKQLGHLQSIWVCLVTQVLVEQIVAGSQVLSLLPGKPLHLLLSGVQLVFDHLLTITLRLGWDLFWVLRDPSVRNEDPYHN